MRERTVFDPIIRPARTSDITQVVALWRVLQEINTDYDPRLTPKSNAGDWFRDYLLQQEDNSDTVLFVAEENREVVGYILGQTLFRPTLESDRCGYVADLCIREDCRGRGIGRSLYQTLIQWFTRRGIMGIEVQVVRANPASQAFWRKMGFTDFLRTLRQEL